MPETNEVLSEAEKLTGLRQIQAALCHQEHPTLRACGLTERIAAGLDAEGLVELFFVSDEGPDLDRYKVERISESGFGILSRSDVAEQPPLRVTVEHPPVPTWLKIRRALVSGLWDVVKIGLGVPVGILVGWFLWKHHWN
jgi:hypothetical protein